MLFRSHILDLSGKSSPLVCFAPTAAADDPVYVNRFLAAYSALGVRNMVLTLWQGAAESVERLSQADIVVSGGGSAANLMALWKMHGVDHVIRRMIATPGPVIADIAVDQKENCFPMIPSGAAHNEMILGAEHEAEAAGITDAGLVLV